MKNTIGSMAVWQAAPPGKIIFTFGNYIVPQEYSMGQLSAVVYDPMLWQMLAAIEDDTKEEPCPTA